MASKGEVDSSSTGRGFQEKETCKRTTKEESLFNTSNQLLVALTNATEGIEDPWKNGDYRKGMESNAGMTTEEC
ncbi:hypothetical protein CapIbe_017813 [Capra ibex]